MAVVYNLKHALTAQTLPITHLARPLLCDLCWGHRKEPDYLWGRQSETPVVRNREVLHRVKYQMPWEHRRRCMYLSLCMWGDGHDIGVWPEGSVRGFQAAKIGRAFQAEAAGCVRAGTGIW